MRYNNLDMKSKNTHKFVGVNIVSTRYLLKTEAVTIKTGEPFDAGRRKLQTAYLMLTYAEIYYNSRQIDLLPEIVSSAMDNIDKYAVML